MTAKELEDFEAFLEPSFDPLQFANGLLLATNDGEAELDLSIPCKKLTYDVQECDKRMNRIATNNYKELVSTFSEVETTKKMVNEQLGPQLQQLNMSFQRVRAGVITPYEEGIKLNKALKKIHTTSNLLRRAGFFLGLVQQAEMLDKNLDTASRDMIQLAKVYSLMDSLYENQKGVNLMSVKIIREYKGIYSSKRASFISTCTQKISNEINHVSTFTSSNTTLHDSIIALYTLEPQEFLNTIEKITINKHSQTISSNLSRALQSPRNFTAVLEEAFTTSKKNIKTTQEILQNCKISTENTSLLDIFLKNQKITSISVLYWNSLGLKFKKNVASTMARGGPIAKNLKIYHEGINKSIHSIFGDDEGAKYIQEAIDLIGSLN